MIFRLEYCNKASVTARVDIQKGGATPIYTVEGTAEPFVLFYNNDKGDKSGSFRSSGADINIYETAEFNIDELKTSNETEISVKYYINNILNWSGFVIPDFFSETITGGKGVVSMVASDRLSTLKGVTLSGLSAKISNRALAGMCLAKTGLSLPLYTMADFTGDGVNIFNSEVLSQRMIDTKGRSISCYDILSSLLEQTNSLLIQRSGAWYIVNKVQLEAGAGSLYSNATTSTTWSENTVNFSEVNVGARRTIIPVASMVGVYHEHGGGQLHPDNYDFSQGLTGWTAVNGFNASIDDREILYYSNGNPYYGDTTDQNYLVNLNERVSKSLTLDTAPYLKSGAIPVVSTQGDMVDISLDINITAPGGGSDSSSPSFVRYAIIATNGSETYALNRAGAFDVYDPTNLDHSQIVFIGSDVFGQITAVSKGQLIKGKLEGDLSDYTVTVRIYGSGTYQVTTVNFISVQFSNPLEVPKGTIYKREQGANYTKTHGIPTVLWGDYLTNGLDGYFYGYPIDDTSSLYLPNGSLHSTWTAYGDTDQIPLLQHISRQKARMFSVAHDLLTADIDAFNFDPLSIFVDCNDKRYVVVSSKFDFLRSRVSVDLEEVAYTNNTVRDLIYSYFGDGEEGIRSVGGISGGTGGGGTHTHANKAVIDQLTQSNIDVLSYLSLYQTGVEMEPLLDEYDQPVLDVNGNPVMVPVEVPVLDDIGQPILDVNGDPVTEQIPVYAIKSTATFFSEKEVSAYGLGDEGSGGGGGGYDMLLSWINYSSETEQWVISAALAKDMLDRIVVLEAGGGGSNVTWGTESGGYVPLTVESVTKSVALLTHTHTGVYEPVFTKNTAFNKNFGTTSTTVARGNHTHSGVYEPVFSKNTAFNKDFGTTSGTVAQGNDSRIVNGQTAYSWGNHASAGYALSSELANYVTLATAQTISGAKTFSANLTASVSVTTPKVIFAAAGWSLEQSGTELQMKYNGTAMMRFLSGGSIVATQEITAYS